MTLTRTISACLLAATITLPVLAQSAPENNPAKTMTRVQQVEHYERDSVDRTYPLHYATSQADQNEILTALRNMVDPITKIFLVPSSNIIVVHAPAETQEQVTKLLANVDLPHPRYRITYTLTELDGTKRVGVQHFSMVVLNGQRSQLKQGSRLPISTGGSSLNFTYIDVGMNFDATLTAVQGGGVLKSNVEQTSIAPDSTSPANPNPVIRQTRLEGTVSVLTGKPLLLGAIDVPASTRHFDMEVQMDPVN